MSELLKIVSLDRETLKEKAGQVIEEILAHYSDFQVRTIDSFMSTVFKASAIDFGYTSDFEILMNPDPLTEYAFGLFLRNVKEGTREAALMDDIVQIILEHKRNESAYLWDPSYALLAEVKKICRKMASLEVPPRIQTDPSEMQKIKRDIRSRLERLEERIAASDLERSETSSFPDLLSLAREERFPGLIGRGLKNNPVRKPKKSDAGVRDAYERIVAEWTEAGLCLMLRAFLLQPVPPVSPVVQQHRGVGQKTPGADFHRGHQLQARGIPQGGHCPRRLFQDRGVGPPLPD
jgi:hypothetical protein